MSPHDFHQRAEQLRETDQHLPALQAIDEAMVGYQTEKNYFGFAQALQSRVLTYKHLFLLTHDPAYLILASHDAQASLEVAQQHQVTNIISSCFFRLGEVALLREDYPVAIENFQKSIEMFTGIPAEKGDYLYHLGEAQYLSGDKVTGKSNFLAGLEEITSRSSGVDPFLIHVWQSGCYLKLAELLYSDDQSSAINYLSQARAIIESDPRLVIRKRQLDNLVKKLKL